MIVCSMIREGFISYALILWVLKSSFHNTDTRIFSVSMKAFDRWIAMKAWSWLVVHVFKIKFSSFRYENGSISTFLLFCFEEFVVILLSSINSYAIVFGKYFCKNLITIFSRISSYRTESLRSYVVCSDWPCGMLVPISSFILIYF